MFFLVRGKQFGEICLIYKFIISDMTRSSEVPAQGKSTCLGVIGCFGGLFIQLVVGSLYQWGIINIYVTSYYRLSDPNVNLEDNAVAFPAMYVTIGLTMRLGIYLSEVLHPILVSSVCVLVMSACMLICSYIDSMAGFIPVYGILFGVFAGMTFMVPIVECNKYFPGRKMYVNGLILIGTGTGPVVFGLFSYNFLNPLKLPPIQGYYVGHPDLEAIASSVPECFRWLSLLYLCIGFLGVLMLTPVYLHNRMEERKVSNSPEQLPAVHNETTENIQEQMEGNERKKQGRKLPPILQQQPEQQPEQQPAIQEETQGQSTEEKAGEARDLKEAFCSWVCWLKVLIILFGSCGVFLVNGNYKTYVKEEIHDDEFLTIIGVVASVGNGCSRYTDFRCRFFWNLLFSRTGYKTIILINLTIQILVYSTIRFTIYTPGLYLFLVFLINCCLGCFLVVTPTFAQIVFGQRTGSNIYGFYWSTFGVANFIAYAFVAGLIPYIEFDGVIYVCLGMCVLTIPMIVLGRFEGPWENSLESLKYCLCCEQKS